MGSSAKTGKFFIGGSLLCIKNIKVLFGIGHPHLHIKPSLYCAGGSGVPNLQTELNYLDSFKSYCNSSDLGLRGLGGWGRWVGGVQGDQL